MNGYLSFMWAFLTDTRIMALSITIALAGFITYLIVVSIERRDASQRPNQPYERVVVPRPKHSPYDWAEDDDA